MNISAFLTLLSAVVVILVGHQVWRLDHKKRRNQIFFLITLLLFGLNICWYEIAQTSDYFSVLHYKKLTGIWPLINGLLLIGFWYYAEIPKNRFPKRFLQAGQLFLLLSSFFFFYLEMFTVHKHGQLIALSDGQWGFVIAQQDIYYWSKAIWSILIYGSSFALAWLAYQEEQNASIRNRKKIIAYSLGIGFAAAFGYNFILPVFYALPLNQSLMIVVPILIFGWAFSDFRLFELRPQTAFGQVVESMPNLMILTSPSGKITKVNGAVEKFFNQSLNELKFQNINHLFQQQVLRKDIFYHTKEFQTVEIECVTPERTYFLYLTISPMFDRNGNLNGYAIVGTDTTEYKEAEAQIKQYASELKESNETIEQFAYIASHDLKEPLRTVNNFATLLKRKLQNQSDTTTNEYLYYIMDGVKRMYAIVESVLEVSRLGQESSKRQWVDTKEVAKKVIREIREQGADKNAIFLVDPLPEIMANPHQIKALFEHLIENAIKYNNNEPPIIEFTCGKRGTYFEFGIQDNGIGIEPAYHERIFQLFKRLHHRTEYEGTGIGLAVCRKIVELSGGRMWVESEPGQGSTFRFTLPAFKAEEIEINTPNYKVISPRMMSSVPRSAS